MDDKTKRLLEAAKNVIMHFLPGHLDKVSSSKCGTELNEALQSANPMTDETKSVPNEGTIVPNLGTEDGGYISTTNDEVLSRIAEAESADLPHIKLKDEARGEGDGSIEAAWKSSPIKDEIYSLLGNDNNAFEVFAAGHRSRDGEVAGLYKELAAHKSELWKAAHAVKRFSSKLDRMEKALRRFEGIESDDLDIILRIIEVTAGDLMAVRQGFIGDTSNKEMAEIANSRLKEMMRCEFSHDSFHRQTHDSYGKNLMCVHCNKPLALITTEEK